MGINLKSMIERVRTVIYLIMCILFTNLLYIYLNDILLKSSDSWLLGGLIIAAVILIDYASRRYVTNLLIFFFIHILLIGAAILIPVTIIDKILLGSIAFSFLLLAIGFWKTESNERSMYVIDVPFGLILFFILIYFHGSISNSMSDKVAAYAYIAGIAYFILYFIREYLNKFLSYSLSSENFSNELKNTFSANFSLLLLFNAIIIFAIMTVNMLFSDSSFNVVGRFFHFLARKFFGLFSVFDNLGETGGEKNVEIPNNQTSEIPNEPTYSYTDDGPNIGSIIFQIFQIAIFIAIIFIIIYIFYSFIKRHMHRNRKSGDIIKETEFKDKKERAAKAPTRSSTSFFASNRDKIRKLYSEKINSITKRNKKIVIRKSYTSGEIESAVSLDETVNENNMRELTKIYQKARYSNAEITKADVEIAKHI